MLKMKLTCWTGFCSSSVKADSAPTLHDVLVSRLPAPLSEQILSPHLKESEKLWEDDPTLQGCSDDPITALRRGRGS